jgi:hypothetical protein
VVIYALWVAISPVWAQSGPVDGFKPLPAGAVEPDRGFNTLFTRYDGGWTGGDGTYSVPLPDGRTVWMFGDTFLGRVNPDRSRPESTPLINNCFVVQKGDDLETRHGGTPENPRALIVAEAAREFYWPADGTVASGQLEIFLNRFQRTGTGPWDWQWIGTGIATFSLPGLKRAGWQRLDSNNGVMYGAALHENGSTVFIYGIEDLRQNKYVHVARATTGHLTGRWEYFTGSEWSLDPAKSARILKGAANQFSVIKCGHRFLLITSDNREPFNPAIVAYVAPTPTGPWMPGVQIHNPPEARGGVVAYNALAHPQFTRDDRLLLSYNLNHPDDFEALYRNADLYRPRFIRVDLKGVIRCLGDGKMIQSER